MKTPLKIHARKRDKWGIPRAFKPLCGARSCNTWDDDKITCHKCGVLLSRRFAKYGLEVA